MYRCNGSGAIADFEKALQHLKRGQPYEHHCHIRECPPNRDVGLQEQHKRILRQLYVELQEAAPALRRLFKSRRRRAAPAASNRNEQIVHAAADRYYHTDSGSWYHCHDRTFFIPIKREVIACPDANRQNVKTVQDRYIGAPTL